MSVREFENKRWQTKNHLPVFRHLEAVKMIKGGRVLDFGCGEGTLYDLLLSKQLEYVGADISEEGARKTLAKGAQVRIVDPTEKKLPFSDDEFDYIVLLDVLEHNLEPEILLAEAGRVAKNIIVSVPNFNSLPARLQVLLGNVPENNRPNKGHSYWFNGAVLREMPASVGLVVTECVENTFWSTKPVIGNFMKKILKIWPDLFALSFVVLLKKNE